jgi:hypothetical protein
MSLSSSLEREVGCGKMGEMNLSSGVRGRRKVGTGVLDLESELSKQQYACWEEREKKDTNCFFGECATCQKDRKEFTTDHKVLSASPGSPMFDHWDSEQVILSFDVYKWR